MPEACAATVVPSVCRWTVQVVVPKPAVTNMCSLSMTMVKGPVAGNVAAVAAST